MRPTGGAEDQVVSLHGASSFVRTPAVKPLRLEHLLTEVGAIASQALLGRDFRVSVQRGHVLESTLAPHVIGIVHP